MEIFTLNDKTIQYILERKKIKNIYISVKEGKAIIRVPKNTSKEKIEEIILKKFDWIFDALEKQQKSAKAPKKYVDGEIFKVLGKEVVLNISYEKIKKPKFKFWLGKFIITLPIEDKDNHKKIVKKLIDNFYTELAEKEVEKAMRKMIMKVGIVPTNYKIKSLKSTWGNCSTTGNISISKNVVMYSKTAIEYVCLHELCHLQYMNHSKSFWNLVEQNMPDYKKAEEELKT